MRLKFWVTRLSAIASLQTVAIGAGVVSPALAQFPIPNLFPSAPNLPTASSIAERTTSTCIRLDGYCLFRIAAPQSELSARQKDIQQRLDQISRQYLQADNPKPDVNVSEENDLPIIEINGEYFSTVTDLDARLQGVDPQIQAKRIQQELQQGLERAKLERTPRFLTRQGAIAGGTGIIIIFIGWGIYQRQRQSIFLKQQLQPKDTPAGQPISTQLSRRQQWNMKEAQHRLLQLVQGLVLGGGGLFILGLFPYTRILQAGIIYGLRIPLQLTLVGLGTYVVIRLSYALIDRSASALASNYLQTPESDRRLQLRVSTVSGVTKSIVTATWVGVGILVAVSTIGINIAPLLAGAGLVGVALSLASQNLIKDGINGFLIILEDQYAVGDVISVGDVGGLVEKINLRITQVRDAEGRLITIPNSEIRIVANLSSNWSRADLTIPVAYHTDVDQVLQLIKSIAEAMNQDLIWREQILEPPQVLGVDNFGDRGIVVRVWIKTQPLKQWQVAREFRRRLKVAFDNAGLPLSLPHQEVWLNRSLAMSSDSDGKHFSSSKQYK
ncbi:MAG: mechanosensitive ion channel family protein [Kastovskya adunca ATA6-11-RM4]|jgi:small conductance mechanosensitive channel|nr:mechanosensitive ion channel family protein [Kastovskya adunca ATA6-11-RM4]